MIAKTISAIALVAIITSIGFTPAFADWNPQILRHVSGVNNGETYLSSQTVEDCAGQTDKCGAQLKVRNTSTDFIYNYYKIGGAGVICDINWVTELDGDVIRNITFYDHETFGQWEYTVIYVPGGIDPADSVETITSFSNCHIGQ
jgi:hypothetical protein